MKTAIQRKTRCPKCGSMDLHNMNLDQMCLDCDWDNSKWLVDQGQLDELIVAYHEQFEKPIACQEIEEEAFYALQA